MRRTSRLVLLLGIFLAALTFVVVLIMGQGPTTGPTAQPSAPANVSTVVAIVEIPLGTVVTAEMFREDDLPVTSRDADAFGSITQVVGKTTRTALVPEQQVGAGDFQNRAIPLTVAPGERAFAIQVY